MKNYSTYTDKYNEFSRTLLRAIIEKEEKKNVVISPLSIIALLCLTARATAGNTREDFYIDIDNYNTFFTMDDDTDKLLKTLREHTKEIKGIKEVLEKNRRQIR